MNNPDPFPYTDYYTQYSEQYQQYHPQQYQPQQYQPQQYQPQQYQPQQYQQQQQQNHQYPQSYQQYQQSYQPKPKPKQENITSVSIIVKRNNKYLIQHRGENMTGSNKISFVSGGIKKGEDPKYGAWRELVEETSISIDYKTFKNLIYQELTLHNHRYYVIDISRLQLFHWVPKTKINHFEVDRTVLPYGHDWICRNTLHKLLNGDSYKNLKFWYFVRNIINKNRSLFTFF